MQEGSSETALVPGSTDCVRFFPVVFPVQISPDLTLNKLEPNPCLVDTQ